jgi:hypothetical protein
VEKGILAAVAPCFVQGTRIATPGGDVCIEDLAQDAIVLTADGAAVSVTGIGRQPVPQIDALAQAVPIRIRSGALGQGLPVRDLLLSPYQAVLLDGVLVQAAALINGSTIAREPHIPPSFVYCHLELPAPALITAEGVPAEAVNGERTVELPYPRAASRRQLPAFIGRKLARRAQALAILPVVAR